MRTSAQASLKNEILLADLTDPIVAASETIVNLTSYASACLVAICVRLKAFTRRVYDCMVVQAAAAVARSLT